MRRASAGFARFVPLRVASCRFVSLRVASCRFVTLRVASLRVVSGRFVLCRVASCRVGSLRATSLRVDDGDSDRESTTEAESSACRVSYLCAELVLQHEHVREEQRRLLLRLLELGEPDPLVARPVELLQQRLCDGGAAVAARRRRWRAHARRRRE